MRRTIPSLWLACLFSIALVGCAGTNLTAILPLEQSLSPYKTLYFSAEPMTTENIDNEIIDLEQRVVSDLNDKVASEWALIGTCTDSCENAILVKAMITDIRKVSSSARFFGGVFAGKASMTADVVFVDAVRKDTVAVYTVTGKSGGTGVSGGTESAVYHTAKAIVELIQSHYL